MDLFYRPPQNHLGTIFRVGRFHKFAPPDRFTFLIPIFDAAGPEIHIGQRMAALRMDSLTTSDDYALDLELKIFYSVDPRRIENAAFKIDSLQFDHLQWEEIVRTGVREVVRNQVFPTFTRANVFTPNARQQIKEQLAGRLSNRLQTLGILVDPQTGISLQNLQHNARLQEAVNQKRTAPLDAERNLAWLRSLARLIQEGRLPDATTAYIWQQISTVQQEGRLPPQFGLLSPTTQIGNCPCCGRPPNPSIVIGPDK